MILGSWVGSLGWLAWRVYHREGGAFSTGAITILPPDAFFYSIEVAGRQVGIASITVDTLTDGLRITERLAYDLPIQRTSTRSQFTNQYTLDSKLRLRDFQLSFPGAGAPIVQLGTREGDSVLVVTPGTGEPRRRVTTGPEQLLPPIMATVALAQQQRLRIGERVKIGVFDPATLTRDTVLLTVRDDSTILVPDSADYDLESRTWKPAHSDTLLAFRLMWQDSRRGFELWVDSRGLPIVTRDPTGPILNRSAFEIVNANYREQRSRRPPVLWGPIVLRTAIASGVVPGAPISRMTIRVAAHREPWIPEPSGLTPPGLTVTDGVVQVDRITLDSSVSELSNRVPPIWLKNSPLLSLGDSAIQEQVRAATGAAQRPDQIARLLLTWVATNIERAPSLGLPAVATVLRSRRADVDGHTLAYVALARAAGIPARPVSGLHLIDGQFYFHSWAEIFLNRWIPVDPTWNQFPADAGRLRLLVNGYAQPLELLPMALGLEVHLNSAEQ